MNAGEHKSRGIFVAAMLIFGTIGLFRRFLPVSSGFLAMVRGLVGGAFVLAFLLIRGKRAALCLPVRTFGTLALSGTVMGFNWILLFEAYEHTTVAVATLCYYMEPTIVTLLSPLLFREKLTGRKMVCVAAAVVGMLLVVGMTEGARVSPADVRGICFGLGAALLYSVVVILNKKTPGVDAYAKTTVQLFSAGIVMIPYLMATGGWPQEWLSPAILVQLGVVGLVHTGVAYVLYFGSMDGLRAQSVAILSYIDPVSALLFSAIFLREPLSVAGIIGAVLIIGSAILSEIKGNGSGRIAV